MQLLICALRAHDALPLCAAILNADTSAMYAAARYCPNRADFIRVWRAIGKNFIAGDSVSAITGQCIPDMQPEKFCLCLMVLLETGLLKSESGSIYGARCSAINGKADLEATRLIRALRQAM